MNTNSTTTNSSPKILYSASEIKALYELIDEVLKDTPSSLPGLVWSTKSSSRQKNCGHGSDTTAVNKIEKQRKTRNNVRFSHNHFDEIQFKSSHPKKTFYKFKL
ncbi:hypothetical protein ABK040_005118 [Willaertia magna]